VGEGVTVFDESGKTVDMGVAGWYNIDVPSRLPAGGEARPVPRVSPLPVPRIAGVILEHAPGEERMAESVAHHLWSGTKMLCNMGLNCEEFQQIMEATWRTMSPVPSAVPVWSGANALTAATALETKCACGRQGKDECCMDNSVTATAPTIKYAGMADIEQIEKEREVLHTNLGNSGRTSIWVTWLDDGGLVSDVVRNDCIELVCDGRAVDIYVNGVFIAALGGGIDRA
jgi:hypothetical protein